MLNILRTNIFIGFLLEFLFFFVNGELLTKIPSEIAEKTIKELILSFKRENLPFYWFVGPLSKPDNLRDLLLKENPSFVEDNPGLAVNLKELSDKKRNTPNLTIKKVQDYEMLKVWVEVVIKGFDLPMDLIFEFWFESLAIVFLGDNSPYSAFLAYYNGTPVATSVGFYGSGVVGLNGITTLKEVRGKGIGSAITLAPLYEAKNLGYDLGILRSTEIGLKMYKSIGFKEYIQIERFVWNFEKE